MNDTLRTLFAALFCVTLGGWGLWKAKVHLWPHMRPAFHLARDVRKEFPGVGVNVASTEKQTLITLTPEFDPKDDEPRARALAEFAEKRVLAHFPGSNAKPIVIQLVNLRHVIAGKRSMLTYDYKPGKAGAPGVLTGPR